MFRFPFWPLSLLRQKTVATRNPRSISCAGKKEDVAAASAYFDKNYSDATAEYLKDIKKGRVYGSLRAWKNGAQYIVLEQDEPGYRSEDRSLSLSVGSKQGMIISNTDLNTCR